MQTVSDVALLERCLCGDRDAFAIIVERHQNLVCSVAYSILGDFSHSEDVGQETLVAAWKQLPELKDLSKFRSWVAAIARHKAFAFRRGQLQSQPLTMEVEGTNPEPGDIAISDEEQSLVWKTLQTLPENYREPLVLFYRQDCSVSQVADSMELSEEAVRQRLHRGREMLRAEVTEVIERTLRASVPGAAFTLAVVGGITGLGASTASAAVAGTAGKMSVPVVAAAAKTGAAAGVLGGVIGVLGSLLGPWLALKNARYESERELLVSAAKRMLTVLLITSLPFLAVVAGWQPWRYGAAVYTVGLAITILLQMGLLLLIAIPVQKEWKRLVAKEQLAGTPVLPTSATQQFVQRWKGRRYTSRTTLLGLPLVQISVSDPGTASYPKEDRSDDTGIARGWIAIGEKAFGVVLAMGGMAVGGIAFGGLGIGLISLSGLGAGVLAVSGLGIGVVSLSGMSVGVFSFGGLAIGWMAFGGAAFAWKCAVGGAAFAHDMAIGGAAQAQHANDDIAQQFVDSHPFFDIGKWLTAHSGSALWFQFVWIVPMAIFFLLCYRYDSPAAASDAQQTD